MFKLASFASFLCLAARLASAQNLLVNGDFSAPNSTAAPTGWNLWSYATTAGDAWANHAEDSYL